MHHIESSEGVVCRVCEVLETPECNILSEFIIVFWSWWLFGVFQFKEINASNKNKYSAENRVAQPIGGRKCRHHALQRHAGRSRRRKRHTIVARNGCSKCKGFYNVHIDGVVMQVEYAGKWLILFSDYRHLCLSINTYKFAVLLRTCPGKYAMPGWAWHPAPAGCYRLFLKHRSKRRAGSMPVLPRRCCWRDAGNAAGCCCIAQAPCTSL